MILQGTLLARDLARHISSTPPSALPEGFLEEANLHGSAVDILRRHSMASLMRRYSALLRVHLKHAQTNLEKEEQAAASKRKRLEVRHKESGILQVGPLRRSRCNILDRRAIVQFVPVAPAELLARCSRRISLAGVENVSQMSVLSLV